MGISHVQLEFLDLVHDVQESFHKAHHFIVEFLQFLVKVVISIFASSCRAHLLVFLAFLRVLDFVIRSKA